MGMWWYNYIRMENIEFVKRKFRLYDDNREYTYKAMYDFIEFYSRLNPYDDFYAEIKELPYEKKVILRNMYDFYIDKFFNKKGEITLRPVNLNKDMSDDEISNVIASTVAFDKIAKFNGWLVDTEGNVYAARNHVKFLNFLTLIGIDCSSYVRVTNNPIGMARLNFSSATDYIKNKPFLMTPAQIRALYNMKRIEEKRFNNYSLPFQDYFVDSMVGGFLVNEPLLDENLKVIEEASPEPIYAKELLRDVQKYKKDKELYKEDFGTEFII